MDDRICEVCNERKAVGIAAIPCCPISAAYCMECIEANAHPYTVVVINTAMIGGFDNASEYWQDIVTDTLNHLKKRREEFDLEVAESIRQLETM